MDLIKYIAFEIAAGIVLGCLVVGLIYVGFVLALCVLEALA